MNPVFPSYTNAAAAARANALVDAVGLRHLSPSDSDQGDPNFYAKFVTILQRMWELLGAVAMGTAVQLVAGLDVEVFAQSYRIGATDYEFEGDSITLAPSNTHYLYLDADETIKSTTGAFPADVYRIAVVTCDGTKVTSIKDRRYQNFGVGAANSWYTIAAAGAVDFDGQVLNDVGPLVLNDPSTLVIASGVITPTGPYHIVRSETVSVADDLVTITADAGKVGQLLLLRIASDSGGVTVKGTGNIQLQPANGSDILMGNVQQHVLLIQNSATTWVTVARPDVIITQLSAQLSAQNQNIVNVGGLNLFTNGVTIASDTADTNGKTWLELDTEGAAALDTLTFLTGGADGDVVVLALTNAARHVNVNHSVIANSIRLANGRDFLMESLSHTLTLRFSDALNGWVEVSRSPMSLDDVAETTFSVPQDLVIYMPGTPSVAAFAQRIKAGWDGIITFADGYAGTAPSGGPLIVDVRVNGNSIFASQAEMVNMSSGSQQDASAVKDHAFSTGDLIDVEVEAANSAANVTVTIHVLRQGQIAP